MQNKHFSARYMNQLELHCDKEVQFTGSELVKTLKCDIHADKQTSNLPDLEVRWFKKKQVRSFLLL